MRRALSVLLRSATVAMVPAAASATPGPGVSGTVLGKGTSNDTIEVRNEGRTDIVVRHIVIEPGGSTGWHYHPGELIAVVHKGTLTCTLEDCSVQPNLAGLSFVETAGDSHAHAGRNLDRTGGALRHPRDPGRCCAVERCERSWLRTAGRAVSHRTARLRVAAGRVCPLLRCSRL